MGYLIEVTSGMRWDRMLKEKNIRLDAPNTTRYQGFFEGIHIGDLVLHYLTTSLTSSKERHSKIVAASVVVSGPVVVGKRIVANCIRTAMLPRPISRGELDKIPQKSKSLAKLLKVNMQRYLTSISQPDFNSILEIHLENKKAFLRLRNLIIRTNRQ